MYGVHVALPCLALLALTVIPPSAAQEELLGGAADDECNAPSCAVGLLQRRGQKQKQKFTFFNPNPQFLVWDRSVDLPVQDDAPPKVNIRNGWLKVPIEHKALAESGSDTPFACLRVRGISSTKRALHGQPAPLGVLLAHCGGPGSGRECTHGIDGDFKLFDYYDHLTIDQRGVPNDKPELVPSDASPLPECPFEDALPYPVIKCNELMSNETRFNDIMAELRLPESLMTDVIRPILLAGGLPNSLSTGLYEYNKTHGEATIRWLYRLAKLEMNLCYANPKYQIKSPSAGSFNAFDHLGTVVLAHDIELLMTAVGQSKLSCWGVSYGTGVCGTFATIFPDRINRLILDGNTDPKPDIDMYVEEASWGPDAVFRGISAACEETLTKLLPDDEKCPMAPFMAEKYSKMIRGNDSSVAYIAGRAFDMMSQQPDLTCAAAMMSCLGWVQRALDADADGSPTPQLPAGCPPEVVAGLTPPEDNSTDPDLDRFGLSGVFSVVALDVAGRWSEDGLVSWWKKAREDRVVGLSRSLLYGLGLGVWPAIPRPMPPIGSVDVRPLIMGNLRDLQTSYDSTQNMRAAFPHGKLLTYQGYGHGMSMLPPQETAQIEASLARGSLPKTNAASRYVCTHILWSYMINGTLPSDGDTCAVAARADVGEKAAEASLAEEAPCRAGINQLLGQS